MTFSGKNLIQDIIITVIAVMAVSTKQSGNHITQTYKRQNGISNFFIENKISFDTKIKRISIRRKSIKFAT